MKRGQSYEYTAKSVEEAVEEGLRQLGISRDQIEVEIIYEGSRGILGIGASDAQVRLTRKPERISKEEQTQDDSAESIAVGTEGDSAEDAVDLQGQLSETSEPADSDAVPVHAAETPPEIEDQIEDQIDEDTAKLEELASGLLGQMLERLGVEADIELSWQDNPEEDDRPLRLNVVGDDLGVLIGRNGETLASIQYLIRLMVNQELHRWRNIVVDIDGYKHRRAEQLNQLAKRLADQVVASGRPASLEPMPASERRLVHIALRDHERVYTASIGEDNRRKVQILPK